MKIFSFITISFLVGISQVQADPCAVVTGKVPFSAAFIYTDAANFVGGEMDDVGMTTGFFRIENFPTFGEWSGLGSSGRISFRENGFFPDAMKPYPSYPAFSGRPFGPFGRPGTTSVEGTIEISRNGLDYIKNEIRSGRVRIRGIDRNNPDLSKVCVHDIGMNVGRRNMAFGGIISGGKVVLWLNGTNQNVVMDF